MIVFKVFNFHSINHFDYFFFKSLFKNKLQAMIYCKNRLNGNVKIAVRKKTFLGWTKFESFHISGHEIKILIQSYRLLKKKFENENCLTHQNQRLKYKKAKLFTISGVIRCLLEGPRIKTTFTHRMTQIIKFRDWISIIKFRDWVSISFEWLDGQSIDVVFVLFVD